MIDPGSVLSAVEILIELSKAVKRLYKVEGEVEDVLSMLRMYSYQFTQLNMYLKKIQRKPVVDEIVADATQKLRKATEKGRKMAERLRRPFPSKPLRSTYVPHPTQSAVTSSSWPDESVERLSVCATAGPLSGRMQVIGAFLRRIYQGTSTRLSMVEYAFTGLDDIKKLLQQFNDIMHFLQSLVSLCCLGLMDTSSMDLDSLPYLEFVLSARTRGSNNSDVDAINFNEKFTSEHLPDFDGFHMPFIRDDEGTRLLLDRARFVDNDEALKASKACARTFQLDGKENPESFRVETGLLSCSALVVRHTTVHPTHYVCLKLPTTMLDNPTTLRRQLHDGPKPSFVNRIRFAGALAHAISAMYAMGLVHRAMTPANILIVKRAGDKEHYECKIGKPYLIGFNRTRPEKQQSGYSDFSRCQFFEQVYCHRNLSKESRPKYSILEDIYSFGVILLEILTWQPIIKPIEDDGVRKWHFNDHMIHLDQIDSEKYVDEFDGEASKLRDSFGTTLVDIVNLCLRCDEHCMTEANKTREVSQGTDGEEKHFVISEESARGIIFLRDVVQNLQEVAEALGKSLHRRRIW